MFCRNCGIETKINTKFCIKCGNSIATTEPSKEKDAIKFFTIKKIILGACILVVSTAAGIATLMINHSSPVTKDQDIASAVVNIYCEGASGWDGDDISGGSGTIVTTEGLVLTNAHVIPSSKNDGNSEMSCLVVLPDPETGSPKEMYYAKPFVVPDISEKYDLAFVMIDDVYYDQDEKKALGEYPKQFPAYDNDRYCKNQNVKLGEPVRIYGYPSISGGYTLTITDGVVSSLLLNEGLIVTSAKISHGNSGGLAVDQHGCRIGIPSMVSSDAFESLGVIISNNLISDFTDEVQAVIENNTL